MTNSSQNLGNTTQVLQLLYEYLLRDEDGNFMLEKLVEAMPPEVLDHVIENQCDSTEDGRMMLSSQKYEFDLERDVADVTNINLRGVTELRISDPETLVMFALGVGEAVNNDDIDIQSKDRNVLIVENLLRNVRWPRVSKLDVAIPYIDIERVITCAERRLPMLLELKCIVSKESIPLVVERIARGDPATPFSSASFAAVPRSTGISSLTLVTVSETSYIGADVHDVGAFGDTCNVLAEILDQYKDCLRYLNTYFYTNANLLMALHRNQRRLLRLSMRAHNDELRHLCEATDYRCSALSLTDLKLHCVVVDTPQEVLAISPRVFPHLRRLAIEIVAVLSGEGLGDESQPLVRMLDQEWPRLRALELPYMNDELAFKISRNVPNLITLKVGRGCGCFHGRSIFPFSGSLSLSNTGILALVGRLTCLRTLAIEHHHAMEYSIDERLLSPDASRTDGKPTLARWACADLSQLSLGQYAVPLQHLAELLKRAPRLEVLSVQIDSNNTSSAVLDKVGRHSLVRSLCIVNNMDMLHFTITKAVLRKFPNVRKVIFKGNYQRRDFEILKEALPNIIFKIN